ncbi:MAG: SLBB domain-containing protein [Treponema sp.]|nr:SLBB domain-containing protein [Treponema sp.]
MKIYSFPQGGIQFADPSVPSRYTSITSFLPNLSVIPLIQHSGGRASPTVAVGDLVREGMLIGQGQGPGSANIHAAVPGRVVRMVSWKTPEGYTNDALIIRMEGAFEKLGKKEEIFPWEGLSPVELQRIIADYGIVEMEMPGRPVSELIAGYKTVTDPFSLVVRCVFDDPWLAADYVLCQERLKAVVEGSAITAKAAGVTRIVFAVSHREQNLGADLLAEADQWNIPASLVLVGSQYPQRNRRELELVLRLYEKKENSSLGDLLILNPATLAAIHDAVKLRKPILDRYIAVGGSAVRAPLVMRARIGTRLKEIFAQCGGFAGNPKRIASGSPIRGRLITDLDEPVIKTSTAFFALLNARAGGERSRDCISCGECRSVCPVGLDPEELYKRSLISGKKGGMDRRGECHGCGCCEVVCPSRLPLSTAITQYALGEN